MNVRYIHTNIIAKDWRKLADFYIHVFGCQFSPPVRDLAGPWLDKQTNMKDVKVKGCHLILPGYEDGPTLEIFSYDPANDVDAEKPVHRYGYGHISFHVDNVQAVLNDCLANGGSVYGEMIQQQFGNRGVQTAVYACDPEGNIVEIVNWS